MLAQSFYPTTTTKGYARENTREITTEYSALRKCRNAVSAGVLSPISSAVGRNGAVGDKRNARAGARNYPQRRQIMCLHRCAATPHPPPSGAPVSLRVGRFADLTRHPRVIQHRGPSRGRLTEVCHSTPRPIKGEGLSLCGPGTCLPVTSSGGRLWGMAVGAKNACCG